MARLRIVISFGLLCGIVAVPACNSTSGSKASNLPQVAFVSNNAENFWAYCEAGCNKAASESGVHCIFRKPQGGDPAKQKEMIDALVNQGVKAIAVSVIDPQNQTDYINKIAAKIPFLAVDNDAPDSKRTCYIGTDNYKAGREAGKIVKEALPNGGTIAIFVGQLEALNARQRKEGLLDELADKPAPANVNAVTNSPDGQMYGKYKLHKTYTDQPEGGAQCKRNVAAALNDLKDEKDVCMIGLWEYNPPNILSEVKAKKLEGKVKIVGFDESLDALKGVTDGYVQPMVVQNPYEFGYQAVKTMAELAKGQPYKGDVVRYIPIRIATKDGANKTLSASAYSQELFNILRGSR